MSLADDDNPRFTTREALFYHKTIRPGKIEIVPSKPVAAASRTSKPKASSRAGDSQQN